MKTKNFISWILLFILFFIFQSNTVFWYSENAKWLLQDRYQTELWNMLKWTNEINKEFNIQTWEFLWHPDDNELEDWTEIDWYNWWQNWRFVSLSSSQVWDWFLEWWFYRLNVWWNNYSFINSFYLWIPENKNLFSIFKSFLTIDRSYQSFTWQDWLLSYLSKRNIQTKYLWYSFFLKTPISTAKISSKEFNESLESYLSTNKTDFLAEANSKEINETFNITVQIKWHDVEVVVIPFQLNPYFNLSEFSTNKYQTYWTWNFVYKSDDDICWTYKADLKWDWTQMTNLYDYDSYINNCWFVARDITFLTPTNYNETFSVRSNIASVWPWLYVMSVMNINQILYWHDSISDSTINEWFSINYWFALTEDVQIFDAFNWTFTNNFLDYVKNYTFTNQSEWWQIIWFDFKRVFSSYADIWKIMNLTEDASLYDTVKNDNVLTTIKNNNIYWHYRNVKDLQSVVDNKNSVLWILWRLWTKITTKYTYSILNNDYTILENLWNSDWISERWFDINSNAITDDCINNWLTNKNKCINNSFEALNWAWFFSWSWAWLNKYWRAWNIFSTIKWVTWKDLYEWTYNTWTEWLDYDKFYIWKWSKTWTKQWFLATSLNRFLLNWWDVKWVKNWSAYDIKFNWETIKKISKLNYDKNKTVYSNLIKNWVIYWPIWNYIISSESDFSWFVNAWWEKLWLYTLEWSAWWTLVTANVDTSTVLNEDLKDSTIKNQNAYWLYQMNTQWIYQDWVKMYFYIYNSNINDRWLVFWLNWIWVSQENDRRWSAWDVFSSYYMEWKTYTQQYYQWDTFEMNNWVDWAWIFTSWNMKWKQYIVSYNDLNYISWQYNALEKYESTKVTWKIPSELKDAIYENFAMNIFWKKFWLDPTSIKTDANWKMYINMYVSENPDWDENIIFEVQDINWNIWYLPIKYTTNWVVRFFNKIAKIESISYSWDTSFWVSITNISLDKELYLSKYRKANYDSINKLFNQTYEKFNDSLYVYEVKDENYNNWLWKKRELKHNIANKYTYFTEWEEPAEPEDPDEDDWWYMWQIWDESEIYYFNNPANSYYYDEELYDWDVKTLLWLTREFYDYNWTPYDPHRSWNRFPTWWESDYNLVQSWYNHLFLVSIYWDKPSYVTMFANKEYLNSAWNHQLINNIYWNWWEILQWYNESYKINKYNKVEILKHLKSSSNFKSNNYFNVDYELNNTAITSNDFSSNTTAKYYFNVISNFDEITNWTITINYQDAIKDYISSKFVCWSTTIASWRNMTLNKVSLRDWNNLRDCKIEIDVQIKKDSDWTWNLAKLASQVITIETDFKYNYNTWTWYELKDCWKLENKIVLNDVTMLSSIPYDSIASIPNCKVIVKNKDTIDTWSWTSVVNTSNITWKYNIIEVDVLYKNPKIKQSTTWDATLKWVNIELNLTWNWKFENFWSEYYNTLASAFAWDVWTMSDVWKEYYNEIKWNSYTPNKITYFVWASHYKRTQFFWKTTFYIVSSTNNLNDFLFSLKWTCTFKYIWASDIKKTMDWWFSFKYSNDTTQDYANLEYYNPNWRDKTLYSTWYSKITWTNWNTYLVKEYQPSIMSLSYIHNGKADNINYEKRIDKINTSWHWESTWITWWITRADWWQNWSRSLTTTTNAPAAWTTWSWSWQSWYWYSLVSLVSWINHIREYDYRRGWNCSRRDSRKDDWETENIVVDLPYRCTSWNTRTKSTATSSRKNWTDWKTWQAFWWYYQLRFDWNFTIWLKQVWTEWTAKSLVVDRIIPVCYNDTIATTYTSKYLDLWWWSKMFLVDTLSPLNTQFVNSSTNKMIWSWCEVSSTWTNPVIEILSTDNKKNTYTLPTWKEILNRNNWFPFFLTPSVTLDKQLPQWYNDIKKQFAYNIKVDKKWMIKLYVNEDLKKEIDNVKIKFKIDNWQLSSSNTTWKVIVKYEVIFNLKYKDKTRPSHVKNNALYKYLDNWDKSKTLFDMQLPVLAISSFNESYSQNETTLINKIMIWWNDTQTKEVVKTSPTDNFTIQWHYKKFAVSEYRTWKNLWTVSYKISQRCSCKRWNCWEVRASCSISQKWTYTSTWKVYQYIWWLNPTEYNFKNQKTENNIINTFYQYTDSIWDQISNKTVLINWIPSVKNIWDNQVLFEWLCDVCWAFQWNIFENHSVWMFNSNVELSKQWTTNIFSYYEDPRNFEIRLSELWKDWANNYQLNAILQQDRKDWLPYVELALIHNNWIPEITPQWTWELWWATYYKWKKALLIKWSDYTESSYKPQPLIISTDILPESYKNFTNANWWNWTKIEDELIIVSDWDIIIWPDVTLINAVLITKWNLIILNWNNSLKIHWWIVIQWKIFNYRININDINPKNFWYNYSKLYKNTELFNLKYPVLFTIDQRYLNSKIFNFVETVYRSSQR